MKSLFVVCLLLVCQTVYSVDELPELNVEDLTLLALKNSSEEVVEEYAFHILKTNKIKEYFKVFKDKTKVKGLIEREKKILTKSLKNVPNKQKFVYKKLFKYDSYNEANSIMDISNTIDGDLMSVYRNSDQLTFMPNYFLLLISNTDLLKNIKINTSRFQHFLNYWKNSSQNYNNNLYLEITLSIEKYQNNQDFQTVIEKIDIYTSRNKQTILATIVENRNKQNLIENWLLSDGYTNKLIGIHAFQFAKQRLQDQMLHTQGLKEICFKTKKIANHQVVTCKKPFTQNSDLVFSYVGGKVAQIDLVAIAKLNDQDISFIQNNIKNFLKVPKIDFKYKVLYWQDFDVKFQLYSDAFLNISSKKSHYFYPYDKKPAIEPDTLILSMISIETLNFLEDIK